MVHVTDNVRPVPYCLATINVALMPVDTDNDGVVDNGMVEVWGSDVNIASFHPCHNRPLDFSFDPDSLSTAISLTCQNVGLNNVPMYVTDDQGRQSFCLVHIVVQNNGANIPNCGPLVGTRPLASGRILDPIGQPIEDVMITHRDMSPTILSSMTGTNSVQYVNSIRSDEDGAYEVDDLQLQRNYSLYAYKEGDVSRVDNNDIQILEAFIRGERYFVNPFTYIAADINEDGYVNVDDYNLFRNLENASEEMWPDQRQWVFYTKTSVDNMSAPESNVRMNLAQSYTINLLDYGYGENKQFVGILKGDLDFYEALGQ